MRCVLYIRKLAPSGCSFLSSLPASAGIHLEMQLDSDNDGIEKDHSSKGLSLQWFPIFVYLCVQSLVDELI